MKKILSLFVILFTIISLNAQDQAAFKTLLQNANNQIYSSNTLVLKDLSNRETFFTENFDEGQGEWTTFDSDADGFGWGEYSFGYDGTACMSSASWDSGAGALTPENWLMTPAIDLSSASSTTTLDYLIAAQDADWEYEHYKLMISTTGGEFFNFMDILHEETLPQVGLETTWLLRSIDLTAYNGETIYLAWVHYDCTDMFQLNLDNVSIYENQVTDVGIIAATSPTNSNGCLLTTEEQVTVTLFNFGGGDITDFDVTYTVNEGDDVTETVEETIVPGSSYDFTFDQTTDMSAFGTYTLQFLVELEDDILEDNDYFEDTVKSTDAVITVHTLSDAVSDQVWIITDENGVDVATGGNYQWNVEDYVDACVVADNCYSFEFTGFDETGWIEVLYNGVVVGGSQEAGNAVGGFFLDNIGDGCEGVGIEDAKVNTIKVYPNPAKDRLTISGDFQSINAEIFNIQGAKVNISQIDNNSIDISNLKQGMYIVKVSTEQGTFQSRFVKN